MQKLLNKYSLIIVIIFFITSCKTFDNYSRNAFCSVDKLRIYDNRIIINNKTYNQPDSINNWYKVKYIITDSTRVSSAYNIRLECPYDFIYSSGREVYKVTKYKGDEVKKVYYKNWKYRHKVKKGELP